MHVGNKKLSYRRETARYFVSLNISLSDSKSLKVIRNDTLKPIVEYFNVTMSVFIVK